MAATAGSGLPQARAPYIPRRPRDGEMERSSSSIARPSRGASSHPLPTHHDARMLSSRTSLPTETTPEAAGVSKKITSFFHDIFSVREPSSVAFDDLVKQAKEGKSGKGVLNLAGVTTAKMPADRPPVNSKWDGMPEGWRERKARSRASSRKSSTRSSKSSSTQCAVSRGSNDDPARSQNNPQHFTNSTTSFSRPQSTFSYGRQLEDDIARAFRSPSTDTLPEITSFFPNLDSPRCDSPTLPRSSRPASSVDELTKQVHDLTPPSQKSAIRATKSPYADPGDWSQYTTEDPVPAHTTTPYPSDNAFLRSQKQKKQQRQRHEDASASIESLLSKPFPAGEAELLTLPGSQHASMAAGSPGGNSKLSALKGILKTQSSSSSLASRVTFRDDFVSRSPSARGADITLTMIAGASRRTNYGRTPEVCPWEKDIEMMPLPKRVREPPKARVSFRRALLRKAGGYEEL